MNQGCCSKVRGFLVQFFVCVCGTLVAVSDGMQLAWSSPLGVTLLDKNSTTIYATTKDINLMQTIFVSGYLCGVPLTLFIIEKLGHKKSLIITATSSLILWLIMGTFKKIEAILAARFFYGVSASITFMAAPVFTFEIAESDYKIFLSQLLYSMEILGYLIIYTVTQFLRYDLATYIGVGLCCLQLATLPFMPDTPYYLIRNGRNFEARKTLKKLRQFEFIEKEFKEIENDLRYDFNEKGELADLFFLKNHQRVLIIVLILNLATQFSGDTVIIMNFHMILKEANTDAVQPWIITTAYVLVLLITGNISISITNKLGRKGLLISSSLLSCIMLLIIGLYFPIRRKLSFPYFELILPGALVIYGAAFQLGLGTVTYIIQNEMTERKMRMFVEATRDIAFGFCTILSLQAFSYLKMLAGIEYPFFIFSACCLLAAIFTYYFVPETNGKTLEDIHLMLRD